MCVCEFACGYGCGYVWVLVEEIACDAVRCSASQCVAVRCSVLQCVAVGCSALQCLKVCFQCAPMRCSAF